MSAPSFGYGGRASTPSAPSAPPSDGHTSIYPSLAPDPYGGGSRAPSGSLAAPPSALQQQQAYPQPHYSQQQYSNPGIPVSIYPAAGGSPAQPSAFPGQPSPGYGFVPSSSPPRSSFTAVGSTPPAAHAPPPQPQPSAAPTLQGGYGPVQPMSAPYADPNALAGSPSSVVELRFRCKGLKKADLLSQSDPFLVLYLQDQNARGWRELGRTETVRNTPDPSFTTAFQLDFFFEELQRLRIEAFDRDSASESLTAHDFLGCVELTMGQLMAAQGQSMVLALLRDDSHRRRHSHGVSGHVVISAEEVSACADRLRVRFAASKLDNKDGWFGASDPFLNIYRLRDAGSDPTSPSAVWLHVWKSEVVMDNLNPRWRQVTLSVQTLCNGDLSRVLKLECMDWEKNGRHQLIGSAIVKAGELVAGEARRFELINRERQLKKGKRYKNSGVLVIEDIECFREHTFAEFLRGGCEVSLILGIDYTASNGAPSDPSSLHYVGASQYGQLNDYQAAISATGAILEPYDSDRRFPVYGFGGMVNGAVSHCFPLTFDPYQPEVEGVGGILRAYADSFQFVRLHGPTNFAPLVRQAAAIAAQFSNAEGSLKYFVLLIITDGAIMDMQQTIDELVQASYQPLSIVIVGVGNADFGAMNALDADGKLLVDSRRAPAARDMYGHVARTVLCMTTG